MRRWLARASRRGALAPLLGPALRMAVDRHEVTLPGLQAPLRVAIVTDLHFGFGPSTAARARAVRARVMAQGADLVLFLGDIAGGRRGPVKTARVDAGCLALAGYAAPLGCYAVLGNHDWDDDPEARERRAGPNRASALLAAQGWRVLENAAADLGPAWIAGVASQRAFRSGPPGFRRHQGLDDLGTALAGVPEGAPLILMAHEPDLFPALPEGRALLMLSGHMHGGQVRLFGRALVAPSRFGTRYALGHFRRGPHQLVVAGGLGCSTIPLRIGIEPSITVLQLVP
ncbi:metallophosphoesterase [Seohaeicola zhoushanensis]|uniref:Metallophosphoesterase n=1 Tax=Seohaeicola zhoushanensis TaxID=1569283 RepID=A0A8J3GWM7_9RHOB|nr:metallophosphoesterase [Seohaeicola zhoushanensis]GHF44885.1 metallophosphoesterase [Seohaeicola zhoushanensis]